MFKKIILLPLLLLINSIFANSIYYYSVPLSNDGVVNFTSIEDGNGTYLIIADGYSNHYAPIEEIVLPNITALPISKSYGISSDGIVSIEKEGEFKIKFMADDGFGKNRKSFSVKYRSLTPQK